MPNFYGLKQPAKIVFNLLFNKGTIFFSRRRRKTLEFKKNCRARRRIVQSILDELPCPKINLEAIDFRAASEFFHGVRGLNMNAGGIH